MEGVVHIVDGLMDNGSGDGNGLLNDSFDDSLRFGTEEDELLWKGGDRCDCCS